MSAFTTSTESEHVWAAYAHALDVALKVVKSKTASVGAYSYDYADLGDVLREARNALADKGAVLTQIPSGTPDGLTWTLTTMILHTESGEWIEFAPYTRPQVKDEQGFGGALTYGRRYSLTSIFAIATLDDDAADVTEQQRNAQKYDGARTREELAVRAIMAVYPADATFREAFLAEFGRALSELPTNRHAEALRWTAAFYATPGQSVTPPDDPPAGQESPPPQPTDPLPPQAGDDSSPTPKPRRLKAHAFDPDEDRPE